MKDVPAMLQLVNYHAGHRGKIIYIGHSLGTTASLMYSSEYPETAARTLGLIVMMAPASKLPNMRSPYRILFPLVYPALVCMSLAIQFFSLRFQFIKKSVKVAT